MADETTTIERIPAPEPGVHPGTEMEEYRRWKAASNSGLSELRKSPSHLRAWEEGEDKDTKSKQDGRIIHTAVLEPDLLESRYAVCGQCEAITGKGERCKSGGSYFHAEEGWLCGTHVRGKEEGLDDSREIVTEKQMAMGLGIRDSVFNTTAARGLIEGTGDIELGVTWDDPGTGVRCKARWDRHSTDLPGGTIVDLKSTTDASRIAFERTIFNYGYHRQAAFYLESARILDLAAQHFCIVAVEKEPPYAVAAYRLTTGAIDAGMEQIRPLLALYAECLQRDEWPGYLDEVVDVALPAWAWSKIDEEKFEMNEMADRRGY